MTLEELIPEISLFKKIIVTGPQRSGTTITTKILAKVLHYEPRYEEEFDVDDVMTFCRILNQEPAGPDSQGLVIQAPGLSSIIHLLGKSEIAIIFTIRDVIEIRESETRIDWRTKGYEQYEKQKYFDNSVKPISEIKYSAWNNFQKQLLTGRWFELDYQSLSSHPLWIEKADRINFDARQTEIPDL